MEKQPPKPMTPFDELVIPQQLHMLKLILPYTPSSNQQFLGVFIKFLELKETMAFFQNSGNPLHTQAFNRSSPPTAMEMLQEIKPYMPPKEAEMMDTFSNMMNIMEMVQMFQGSGGDTGGSPFGDMSDMFSSFGGGSGGINPMDMMMGMLTPEQQNMFQMYNHMFEDEMNSNEMGSNENSTDPDGTKDSFFEKGDDTDERMDEQSGNEEYRPG